MAQLPADRVPVIVGVGEVTDRPADPLEGKEPIALMAEALRLAEEDAGSAGRLLAALDSLDIVNEISWPYRDPVGRLGAGLGITPARAAVSPPSRCDRISFCATFRAMAASTSLHLWSCGLFGPVAALIRRSPVPLPPLAAPCRSPPRPARPARSATG